MVFAFCAGGCTGFVIVLAGLARHQKIIMSVRCLYLLDLKGLFAIQPINKRAHHTGTMHHPIS